MARYSRRNRKMRGGSYSSASSYGTYVNGSGDAQYNRVFDQAGQFGKLQGNIIIGAQGQNVTPVSQVPNSNQLSLIQSAGRRRRSRKGGFVGEVINQAIVPFSILGMQQTYRRKSGGRRSRTRRHRRRY